MPDAPPSSTPRRLVVELPLPPRECSPNWCGHWRPRANARALFRKQSADVALVAARAAGLTGSLNSPVRLLAEFYMARNTPFGYLYYRPRDADNAIASIKGAIDGLRDSGAIFGDEARNMHLAPPRLYSRAKEHQGRAALVLTIEEVTEDV